jgi:hypothetical protein
MLMNYNTVKHDTDRQVRTAARRRALNGAGSGWEVPLRQDSLVGFESRGLPVLTQNVELTSSPWRSNTTTEAVQGPAKISETGEESIQDSRDACPMPVPTRPEGWNSRDEGSHPVTMVVNRVNSSPYYHRPASQVNVDDKQSSADVWGGG